MTVTIKSPKAIKTHGVRRFVGVPVRTSIGHDAVYEGVLRQAGEGDLISEENGVRVYDLVILDGTSGVLGDWIVRYTLDNESGISIERVWAAAEIN